MSKNLGIETEVVFLNLTMFALWFLQTIKYFHEAVVSILVEVLPELLGQLETVQRTLVQTLVGEADGFKSFRLRPLKGLMD